MAEISARVNNIVGLNRFRKINVEHSRFELAAELSAEGLVIVNEDEEILFANQVARRLFRIANDATEVFPGREGALGCVRLSNPRCSWFSTPRDQQSPQLARDGFGQGLPHPDRSDPDGERSCGTILVSGGGYFGVG